LDWHKDINDYWQAKMNLFRLTDFIKIPNFGNKKGYEFFKTNLDDYLIFVDKLLAYF
jgi:UDP-N-acetylmuramoylalanine-D-glutamate ligase